MFRKTLPKPNIPYPSRLNDQKFCEKASNQMEKIFQIFQDLRFDISFADALLLMLRFAPIIKSLLMNKDKLFELAKIPLNENYLEMLLKKLPKNLRDPGKFLIPYFPARITPTRMTLEIADRSITRLKESPRTRLFQSGELFTFLPNFVVDFEADPRVPLILGRSFLRTGHALIDVYGEEITLRVNDKAVTFNLDQTTRYSSTYDDMSVNRIDVIDVASEEYAQEVLGFSNNSSGGNPTMTFEPIISDSFLSFTPFEESDFILEEIEAFLKDDSISPEIDHAVCDPEGDICLIEKLLNNDPFQLPPMNLKQVEVTKAKSSIEEPPELELKDLPSHLEYAYLEGIDKLPVIIAKGLKDDEKEALLKVLKSHKRAIAWKITDIKDPQDQEKTTFTCPYGTFAYRRMPFGLCNAPGTFQRCMMAIFHDMIEKTMEVFMDDFLVFGDIFATCLSNLDKMLKRCEDMNLVLNWEKCHFMCKEGIVLGHKISKSGIEVDRAKNDVIAKLPHPTIVKGVRSFLETPFVFSKHCIDAFETLKKKLNEASILVVPDWNLPFELMCDASDFAIVIHKESTIPLNKTPQISLVNAITHDFPTEEPEYSLSMGDEHLRTVLETELDEVIKSSVENLVPIPSESEVTSDNESECDVPVNDESSPIFTTFSNPLFDCNDDFTSSDDKSLSNEDVPMENFKIYSNPLFDDEEIISTKIDLHYFNVESNLIKSLLNRDTLIHSSPKFDYLLEEFSSELAHIDPIPPGIEEADFDLEEEIRLVENLSLPPPSPIPVTDSDSLMKEIDLFLASDDSMLPGIENDDYDSEGDIRFLEELLSNDSPPLPENKSSKLDHFNDPSSSRPPPKPSDAEVCFDIKPDKGVVTNKVVGDISEHDVLMPNLLPT
ncbi:reverse transcriptase domain-containing protein [Tanacetum coccineum]|uniref:Reverse transcriptase domain-containing protein n=1 Tax=Tanacetum coccineum TaxID=301880 RepID=A0ABQ5CBZ1_9ASTR